MSRERRVALGIPVHDTDADHTYVGGYCTCGAQEKRKRHGGRYASTRQGGTRAASNLDRIEGNPGGDRS